MLKYLLVLSLLSLQAGHTAGQCPDRPSLWKRLDSILRDPRADQLPELVGDRDKWQACHYAGDSTFVFLLQRLGMAYHLNGDEVNAYRCLKNSIDVITANQPAGRIKKDQLLRSYFNLGEVCDSLKLFGERDNARDSFINLALRIGRHPPQLYSALLTRAIGCFNAGDYHRCLDFCAIPDELPAVTDPGIDLTKGYILGQRLNALLALHRPDSAESLLTANLLAARNARNVPLLAVLHGIAANIDRHRNDYPHALANFQKEYEYFRTGNDTIGCAESLNAIGYLYFEKFHDPAKAHRFYRQSLSYKDGTEAISTCDNLALLFAADRQYDSSFFYFQQAFDHIGPGADETTLRHLPVSQTISKKVEYVTELILDKGDVFCQLYEHTGNPAFLRQALRVYTAADQFFHLLEPEQTDFASRLLWRSNNHRLYEHAITAAARLGDPDALFYFLEKSRAVLLGDQLSRQRWTDNTDVAEEAKLKKDIQYLSAKHLQTDLFAAKQALTLREQRIRQLHPLYYKHFLDTAFITLSDIRTYLRTNRQTLLLFYTGDTVVYTLLITPDLVQPNRISRSAWDTTANSFMAYLADPSRLNHDMPGYIRTAHDLYKLIFPIPSLPPGRIIISPDGNYFPFEALVTSDSLQNPSWFLYDHPTFYTYSASYLLATSGSDSLQTNETFLGMAPVRYAPYQHLPPLEGSDRSLDQIAANFGSADQFLEARASRNNFLQNFSHYRLIQLYTHAVGNTETEPVIYFADSALPLSDLIPEDKPVTRLIVLSACESGNGQFYQGEGIFSFNREFAALGIPAAIINRWSVDDRSTYRLTELFYKYLAAGDTADIALYKAKMEFIRSASADQRLPYYWAAPLLTGTAEILSPDNPSHTRWWIIPLLVIAILAIFYLKKRNKLRVVTQKNVP